MQSITEQQVKNALVKIADSLASFTFGYPVPLKMLAHNMGVDLRPAPLSVISKIAKRSFVGREIKDCYGRVFYISTGKSLDGCRLLLTHMRDEYSQGEVQKPSFLVHSMVAASIAYAGLLIYLILKSDVLFTLGFLAAIPFEPLLRKTSRMLIERRLSK